MLVYNGTKSDFMLSVEKETIAFEIENKLMFKSKITVNNEICVIM